MAQCCIEANNLDCADQSLAKAKNLESGLAEIYRELGRVFEKRGQVDKAVESYQLYVELSPNAMDRDMIIGRIMQLRSGGF
jgi:tetratricopeptide (TPR) repeat protein